MDSILYWNEVANEANRTTHTTGAASEADSRGPCGSSRAYAIVHLAMHDAYFGIHPAVHGTYLDTLPSVPVDADADAAIAGAAHTALSALYPDQRAFFNARHAAAGLTADKGAAASHAFGAAVAAAVLAARQNDPDTGDIGHASSVAPGAHRHDPDADPSEHGYHAPFYGARSRCFAVTERHHLDAPPELGSQEYNNAVTEVRVKGIAPHLMGTVAGSSTSRRPTPRTPSETVIGLFWGYDGAKGLGTPPRLFNRIVRQIAEAQGNNLEQNARLFALVNAAMGDAGILAWDDKYFYDLWRPVIGIREHDPSMGPTGHGGGELDSQCDPGWLPLGAPRTNDPGKKNFSPPFPAYPSGHATFGAAAFQVVRRFYNDACGYGPDELAKDLEFVSEELDGINVDNTGAVRPRHVRQFRDGLWQMIEENSRSRVFLGVHWVFDGFAVKPNGQMDLKQNIGGVRLGLDIADDIFRNGLTAADAAGPRLS